MKNHLKHMLFVTISFLLFLFFVFIFFDPAKDISAAAYLNQLNKVKLFLMINPRLINVRYKKYNGNTPLIMATISGNKKMVHYLVSRGADVNLCDFFGNNSLHYAAQCNYPEIAEILIKNGTNVNAKNNYGKSPIFFSMVKNNNIVIELLVTNGADVNAKDNKGNTPLKLAKNNSYTDIANFLRRHGAIE